MKLKLLNVLTVCLVTLGVLAPALLVFGLIWERHIDLVKTHYIVYEFQKERVYADNQKTTYCYKQTELLKSYNGSVGQLITPSQEEPIAHILRSFIFFVPIGICLGFLCPTNIVLIALLFSNKKLKRWRGFGSKAFTTNNPSKNNFLFVLIVQIHT